MSLGDPAKIFLGHCLFSCQIASNHMLGQVNIHIGASVNACTELNHTSQKRISSPRHRHERNLLTNHICFIEKAKILSTYPLKLSIPGQIPAQKHFLDLFEVQRDSSLTWSNPAPLIEYVGRKQTIDSIWIELEFWWVLSSWLKCYIKTESIVLIVSQHDISLIQVLKTCPQ